MIQRNDGQHPVGFAQTDVVGDIRRHGVQPHRPVGVQHALGPSRRARGVAQGAGRVLGDVGKLGQRRRPGDEIVDDGGVGKSAPVPVEAHELLDGSKAGPKVVNLVGQVALDEQDPVGGMACHIRDLVGVQAHVDGVDDRSDERRRVVQLEVPGAGGDGADAISRLHAAVDGKVDFLSYYFPGAFDRHYAAI
ncbi:hypothetical protein BH24ACT5_BH24ACT5_07270 [soil metagenome]